MNKQQLLEKQNELELNLYKIREELLGYDRQALRTQYGDKYNCAFCRFVVVLGFSYDGWHNLCGADICTCCHNCCDQYKPDNAATAYIKDILKSNATLIGAHISREEHNALEELDARIFEDNVSDYTMELLKLFIEHKASQMASR